MLPCAAQHRGPMGPTPFAAIRYGGPLPQHPIASPRPSSRSPSTLTTAAAPRGDYSYARREREPSYDDDYLPQTEEITSLQNSVVKHCVKLRSQKSYRDASRTALLTGADLVAELSQLQSTEILTVFYVKDAQPPTAVPSSARVVAVSEGVMQKISGLESVGPASLAAEVALPPPAEFEAWRPGSLRRLLTLERCQDPGNLGTLLRSALAMGWDGVFLLPGCADPFNDKALRASRGACFKLPMASGTLEDWQRATRQHSLVCLAAELDRPAAAVAAAGEQEQSSNGASAAQNSSENRVQTANEAFSALTQAHVSLVLGSEGQGLSAAALKLCRPVTIPMLGDMESLNVAAAGAILLWCLSGSAPLLAAELAAATGAGGNGDGSRR